MPVNLKLGAMAQPMKVKTAAEKDAERAGRDAYRSSQKVDKLSKKDPDEIKKLFDKETNSGIRNEYGRAYLMSKYGNKYKDFIDTIYHYSDVYGLDNDNPYIKFMDNYKGKIDSPELASEYAKMIDDDESIVDDTSEESLLYSDAIKSRIDDFKNGKDKAYFLRTLNWLSDSDKMSKWEPEENIKPEAVFRDLLTSPDINTSDGIKKKLNKSFKPSVVKKDKKDQRDINDLDYEKLVNLLKGLSPERKSNIVDILNKK